MEISYNKMWVYLVGRWQHGTDMRHGIILQSSARGCNTDLRIRSWMICWRNSCFVMEIFIGGDISGKWKKEDFTAKDEAVDAVARDNHNYLWDGCWRVLCQSPNLNISRICLIGHLKLELILWTILLKDFTLFPVLCTW